MEGRGGSGEFGIIIPYEMMVVNATRYLTLG